MIYLGNAPAVWSEEIFWVFVPYFIKVAASGHRDNLIIWSGLSGMHLQIYTGCIWYWRIAASRELSKLLEHIISLGHDWKAAEIWWKFVVRQWDADSIPYWKMIWYLINTGLHAHWSYQQAFKAVLGADRCATRHMQCSVWLPSSYKDIWKKIKHNDSMHR